MLSAGCAILLSSSCHVFSGEGIQLEMLRCGAFYIMPVVQLTSDRLNMLEIKNVATCRDGYDSGL